MRFAKFAGLLVLLAVALAVVTVFTGAQGPDPEATLKVGDTAPKLEVAEWVKGDEVKFEPGKVYVVEFWATWCPPCRKSIPHLTELQEKYKDRQVTIIGVTMEESGTVKPFVEKQAEKMVYTVAIDAEGKTSKAYMDAVGARGIPHAFVIDKEGKLAWHGHPMDDAFDRQIERHAPPKPQDS